MEVTTLPKKTRKYPTEKKTTTPEGYREYKKLQMREYRARKKAEIENLKKKIQKLYDFLELKDSIDENIRILKKLIKIQKEFRKALEAIEANAKKDDAS